MMFFHRLKVVSSEDNSPLLQLPLSGTRGQAAASPLDGLNRYRADHGKELVATR